MTPTREDRPDIRGEPEPASGVAEELAFHLACLEKELIEQGIEPERAACLARDRFGDVAAVGAACTRIQRRIRVRRSGGSQAMTRVWENLSLAVRTLLRRPGFTIVACATLALGIGANTAIFAVVNTVLLRPLPFPEPDRLVRAFESRPRAARMSVAPANYLDWRRDAASFEHLASYRTLSRNLVGIDRAQRLMVATVSGNFFEALGTPALLGRTLDAESDGNGERTVVLGHPLWAGTFGSDPAIVGRTIDLDGTSFRVLGVMPEGFAFPAPGVQLWTHAPFDVPEIDGFAGDLTQLRDAWYIEVVGRLADGVTLNAAQSEMSSVADGLSERYPDNNRDASVVILPLKEVSVASARTLLWVLLGAVGLLWAAACANVANLVLVRVDERRRELAVRSALGARRSRVVGVVVAESLVLAVVGGAIGALVSLLGVGVLQTSMAPFLPRANELGADSLVLLYATLLTVAATVACGALPAWSATRASPARLLSERSGARAGGLGGRRARSGLVAAQVGLATVLVLGTGLLLRSFAALHAVDMGYQPEGLLAVSVSLPSAVDRSHQERTGFYGEILERARRIPGVVTVGAATVRPNSGGPGASLRMPDRDIEGDDGVRWQVVTPDYFETLGARIVEGRGFTWADRDDGERVSVVNRALADRFFPGESPVGRSINTGLDGREPDGGDWYWTRIVGVVEDIRSRGPTEPAPPTMYRPIGQSSTFRGQAMVLVLRTVGEAPGAVPGLRRAVTDAHPDAPLYNVATGDDLVARFTTPTRVVTLLLGGFAGLALALGAIGVYGVTATLVRGRRREIGVRMALGARAREVTWMVTRQGIAPAALGLVLGVSTALVGARALRSFLFEVEPTDPATFFAVGAALTLVAAFASALPARGAARVDPVEAMRPD